VYIVLDFLLLSATLLCFWFGIVIAVTAVKSEGAEESSLVSEIPTGTQRTPTIASAICCMYHKLYLLIYSFGPWLWYWQPRFHKYSTHVENDVTELNWCWPVCKQSERVGHWLTRTWAYSRGPPTPLDGAYCNAILLARLSVHEKLNHVSSVQLRRFVGVLLLILARGDQRSKTFVENSVATSPLQQTSRSLFIGGFAHVSKNFVKNVSFLIRISEPAAHH